MSWAFGPPKEMKIADHLRLSPPPVTAAEVSATFPFLIAPALACRGSYGLASAIWEKNDTAKIAMDARPGGPTAKREPSPEGLGLNPQDDLSAVGAPLNLGRSPCVIRSELRISYYANTNHRPRMRLSVRKAALGLSTPLSLIGNLEEAEGAAVQRTSRGNVLRPSVVVRSHGSTFAWCR